MDFKEFHEKLAKIEKEFCKEEVNLEQIAKISAEMHSDFKKAEQLGALLTHVTNRKEALALKARLENLEKQIENLLKSYETRVKRLNIEITETERETIKTENKEKYNAAIAQQMMLNKGLFVIRQIKKELAAVQ